MAIEMNIETTANNTRVAQRIDNSTNCVRRRKSIGVQKPKHVSFRRAGARMHLRTAPAISRDQLHFALANYPDSVIVAASVNDDYFNWFGYLR